MRMQGPIVVPNPKPTTGPWAGEDSIVTYGNIERYAIRIYGSGDETVGFVNGDINRNGPNARLIAAAPDLLESAKTIMQSLKWEESRSGTTYNGYEALQNAIDKAEGK